MIATAVGQDRAGRASCSPTSTPRSPPASRRSPTPAPTGQYFAMADGWKEGSTVSIRMFGQGALVSAASPIAARPARTPGPARSTRSGASAQTDVEGLTGAQGRGRALLLQRLRRRPTSSPTAWPATRSGSRCRSSRRTGAQAARRHLDVRRPAVLPAVHRRARRRRTRADARDRPPRPGRRGASARRASGLRPRGRSGSRSRSRSRSLAVLVLAAVHLTQGTLDGRRRSTCSRLAAGGDDAGRRPGARRLPAAPAAGRGRRRRRARRRRRRAAVAGPQPARLAGHARRQRRRVPRRRRRRRVRASRCRSLPAGGLAFVGGLAAAGAGARAVGRRRGRADPADPRRHRRSRWRSSSLTIAAAAPVRAGDDRPVRLGQRLARAERPATASPSWRPVVAVGVAGLRRCSAAGSTSSRSATTPRPVLGVDVRRTRLVVVLLAVLLSRRRGHARRPDRLRRPVRAGHRPAARPASCRACSGTALLLPLAGARRRAHRARRRRAAARRPRRPGRRGRADRRGHHDLRRRPAGLAGPPATATPARPGSRRPRGRRALRYPRVLRRRPRHVARCVAGCAVASGCSPATPGCSPATS